MSLISFERIRNSPAFHAIWGNSISRNCLIKFVKAYLNSYAFASNKELKGKLVTLITTPRYLLLAAIALCSVEIIRKSKPKTGSLVSLTTLRNIKIITSESFDNLLFKFQLRTLNCGVVEEKLSDLDACISRFDMNQFKKIIKGMLENRQRYEAAECINGLLNKYSQNPTIYENLSREFIRIQSAIHEIFPNFNNFYFKCGEMELMLNKGIDSILEKLKQENENLKDMCVHVCYDFDLNYNIQDLSMQSEAERCFIVREKYNGYHWSAVYVKKMDKRYRFVVCDSVSHEANSRYAVDILTTIYKAFGLDGLMLNTLDLSWLEIYIQRGAEYQCRQSNEQVSCCVFAIQDAVKLWENRSIIFDWIATNGNMTAQSQRLWYFSFLPRNMMKTTQSMKQLKDYDEKFQLVGEHSLSQKVDVKYAALAVVPNSKGELKEAKINTKVIRLFLQFNREIIKHVVETSSASS